MPGRIAGRDGSGGESAEGAKRRPHTGRRAEQLCCSGRAPADTQVSGVHLCHPYFSMLELRVLPQHFEGVSSLRAFLNSDIQRVNN